MKISYYILTGNIVILALLIVTPLVVAETSHSIKLSTPFPRIEINPGQEIRLNLYVNNFGPEYETLNLTVSEPENWKVVLKSGAYIVKMVSLAPGENRLVELIVSYPEAENIGSYMLEIRALDEEGNIMDSLDIIIDIAEVSELETFGILISSVNPTLQGRAESDFEFEVRVTNETGEDKTIELFASSPPDWTVTFKPRFEGTVIRAVTVEAGKSNRLNVTISPPPNVKAGDYTIPIQASSGPYEEYVGLTVVITGSYELALSTPGGLLSYNAPQGEKTIVPLAVKNEGSGQLFNVTFVSTKLPGWEISFEPNEIPSIPPGTFKEVNVGIRPPNDAIPGDYEVRLRVSAEPHFPSDILELRVTVLRSTVWGIVGILIIVLIVIGLLVIFWRLGRR